MQSGASRRAEPLGIRRALFLSIKERTMPHEIAWSNDFDTALSSAGDKLVLLDFNAAPM